MIFHLGELFSANGFASGDRKAGTGRNEVGIFFELIRLSFSPSDAGWQARPPGTMLLKPGKVVVPASPPRKTVSFAIATAAHA